MIHKKFIRFNDSENSVDAYALIHTLVNDNGDDDDDNTLQALKPVRLEEIYSCWPLF